MPSSRTSDLSRQLLAYSSHFPELLSALTPRTPWAPPHPVSEATGFLVSPPRERPDLGPPERREYLPRHTIAVGHAPAYHASRGWALTAARPLGTNLGPPPVTADVQGRFSAARRCRSCSRPAGARRSPHHAMRPLGSGRGGTPAKDGPVKDGSAGTPPGTAMRPAVMLKHCWVGGGCPAAARRETPAHRRPRCPRLPAPPCYVETLPARPKEAPDGGRLSFLAELRATPPWADKDCS